MTRWHITAHTFRASMEAYLPAECMPGQLEWLWSQLKWSAFCTMWAAIGSRKAIPWPG